MITSAFQVSPQDPNSIADTDTISKLSYAIEMIRVLLSAYVQDLQAPYNPKIMTIVRYMINKRNRIGSNSSTIGSSTGIVGWSSNAAFIGIYGIL